MNNNVLTHGWYRFTGITGLEGVTVNSAVLSLHNDGFGSGSAVTNVYAENQEAPTAPSSALDYNGRTVTSSSVSWNGQLSGTWNTKDVAPVIQELANNHDSPAVQILHKDGLGSGDHFLGIRAYDFNSSLAAKLDIDYTEPPSVGPASITKAARFASINKSGRWAPRIDLRGRYDAIEKEGLYQE